MFFLLWWYLMDGAKLLFSRFNVIFKIPTMFNTQVFLTIDDVITNTDSFEETLQVLDNFNANATFFVISSLINKTNEHLLIQALKSGHHLANHGKNNRMHGLCSETELIKEILDCERLIEELYKKANVPLPITKYFRPGAGICTNAINNVCDSLDYTIVLGSVYPSDTKLPFPNLLSWYIKTKTVSGDIIILHNRSHCPSTLKKMLPYIMSKYKVTSLPNL
jgi:peptidoglycan/xylan/chitin deacetylase (PgdA/CDA1 family)